MRFKLVFKLLEKEDLKGTTVLDFGCGTGIFLSELDNHFSQLNLVGFEFSQVGVDICKKKIPSGNFYKKDMLSEDKYPENMLECADYSICTEVLEHLDNPVLFLKNTRKYMKVGAKMIITVPGGKMSEFDKYLGHRKHFSTAEMEKLLRSAGFTEFKIKAAGYPFFNLYKLMIILRGKHMIKDCKRLSEKQNFFEVLLVKLFGMLFHFNLNNTPLGWQIIAEIENI